MKALRTTANKTKHSQHTAARAAPSTPGIIKQPQAASTTHGGKGEPAQHPSTRGAGETLVGLLGWARAPSPFCRTPAAYAQTLERFYILSSSGSNSRRLRDLPLKHGNEGERMQENHGRGQRKARESISEGRGHGLQERAVDRSSTSGPSSTKSEEIVQNRAVSILYVIRLVPSTVARALMLFVPPKDILKYLKPTPLPS